MATRRALYIIDGIVFACLFALFLSDTIGKYRKEDTALVMAGDVKGYYIYLPTVFNYGGVHSVPERFMGERVNEKGETYSKYTCGTAYCYLPFFLAARLYVNVFHLDPSPFSLPYYRAIIAAGLFWAIFGLFVLKSLLAKYFSWPVVWLTMICIVFGTNLYGYATLFVGMSHIYSFALVAIAFFLTDRYYIQPTKGRAIFLSIILAWIILIRPTNFAIIIFLSLYRVASFTDLKDRFRFFRVHLSHLLIGLPFFVAVIMPQLLYWKEMTGHWIKYSYEDEHFIYWKNPKIAAVLFDTPNGWLLYSPILLFMLWSLIFKRRDPRANAPGSIITLAIITYLFASWWAWSFRMGFGHRCYVDYYALLAFPMAVTMESISGMKNLFFKILLFIVIILMCYYSVVLTRTYFLRYIPDDPLWRWQYGKWWEVMKKTFSG
jgi:hypothetical protein